MTKAVYILIFGILSLLVSCLQPNATKSNLLESNNPLSTTQEQIENDRLEKRKTIEVQEKNDSLRLNEILKGALKIANENICNDKFFYDYEIITDSIPTKVEISSDYFFTNDIPHLIIRRNESGAIYIDIYCNDGNNYKKVVSHEQWSLTYVNDTIRDINGDNLGDFVVNWYGASGCCLKAFSNVYLLRQDKKEFSKNFEFINPTFSPNEKIIRGVCYGHPGETEMYKYKWNGDEVDTLEYVFYEKNNKGEKTGKVVVSDNEPYMDKFKILKLLDKVPAEYKKIEGYDWFTGTGYE